mmetsp:Transcript_58703/g.135339  ORF Transcript_58703/g.135339 Transcript_58703/m.135339 type:complete len:199 (-) Transcript_58703:212-808(-)
MALLDDPGASRYAQHWSQWYSDHQSAMEWHLKLEVIQELLHPYLDRALSQGGEILDIGCGSSTWGVELLRRWPASTTTLLDCVPELVAELAKQYEGDSRVRCVVGDCRQLEVADGSVAVVLDKGTLDALDAKADQDGMLEEAVRVLSKTWCVSVGVVPNGTQVAVSAASRRALRTHIAHPHCAGRPGAEAGCLAGPRF